MWRREDGVSAVEFALIMPVLGFGLLATLDVALSAHERMAIGHVLRAGAQVALEDPGADQVQAVLSATATEFVVGCPRTRNPLSLCVAVDAYCQCPGASGQVDCTSTATCSASRIQRYYRLRAEKQRENLVLPSFSFAPQLVVQVR